MPLNKKNYGHDPVLTETVEKYAGLQKGDTVIDCTLGLGGHSEMFLEMIGKKGTLVAFEQDERNLEVAKKRLNENKNKILFIHKNFVHLQQEVQERKIEGIKLIFMDLGLASTHIDDPERGFAFLHDGPLDMRFDKRSPLTAERILERYSVKRLEEIFKVYGEERYSKKFARIIKENIPFHTTTELANFIEQHYPKGKQKRGKRIHPATKIFQALRIEVNNELEILEDTLQQAIEVLDKGGRLMVISYHSLEDRIVKRAMKAATKECICPPEKPICDCNHKPVLKILTKKPITPTEEEIEKNPRSRSAKLRTSEKI
ncbi:16S rRNA (cytosine(1402)-N(4))-methyltransferase RsmH [Patescibacteria group bacterium]